MPEFPSLQQRFIDECPHELGRRLARRVIPSQIRDVRHPTFHEVFARFLTSEADATHELTEPERRGVPVKECETVEAIRRRFLSLLPDRQRETIGPHLRALESLAAGRPLEDEIPEPPSADGVPVGSIEDRRRWLRLFSRLRALLCTGRRFQERRMGRGIGNGFAPSN
jgi:hypothetical protein